ncbi:hypothetical protein DRQ16_03115 [bacterium]|nr:MAG: hypothetical protein DRQ16_03115 [bacterium]
MKRVFLDTSALYSILTHTDKFHENTRKKYISLIDSGYELWITEWVFEECVSLIWYRTGKDNGIRTALWMLEHFYLYRFEEWEIKEILKLSGESDASLSLVDFSLMYVVQKEKALVFTLDRELKELLGSSAV